MAKKEDESLPTKFGVILSGALLVSGCGSREQSPPDNVPITRYYGFFKTSAPNQIADDGRLGAYEISGVGVRANNGIGVGYFHEKILSIPLDCRLVVLVNDIQQLEQALNTIKTLQGEGACVGRQ